MPDSRVSRRLKREFLVKAETLEELANKLEIDEEGLKKTVKRWREMAIRGVDEDFGRGESLSDRYYGDDRVTPNPCMAPIAKAPFYAVKIVAGSFGAFIGLKTDAAARVLDAEDKPIAGLYAAGTDMASVFGGFYPAGGINIGPALTFGHIAALHAAGCLEEPR